MTPLEVFLARWAEAIPAIALVYLETVNKQVDLQDVPEPWGAVIIQPETRSDVTLGSMPWVEERGRFFIGLATRSGLGPAALDNAVDYIRQVFHGYRKNGLWIWQVEGPQDTDPDANGEWWQIMLTAPYMFQTRRDATGPGYGDWSGFPNAPPPPLPGP